MPSETWTDAEKELDTIRQKAEERLWTGIRQGSRGLLLTYRTNDGQYTTFPKILASPGGRIDQPASEGFRRVAA